MPAGVIKTVVFGISLLLLLSAACAAEPLLRPHDRLAICGDLMTSGLGYTVYVEDYLRMCQPGSDIDVAQFGWSSPQLKGFFARLESDLLPFKPTVVLTCFGTNEFGCEVLTDDMAASHRQAQTQLIQALKKAGVRTIVVGSPRCVDSFTFHHDPSQAAIFNKLLGALAEIDKQCAAQEGVIYADVFGATMAAMQKMKKAYGEEYVFDAENGAPDDQTSLVVAFAFLKALGYDGAIGTITADFAAGNASGSPDHKVVSYQDYVLTIESSRYPFWFPGYPSGRAAPPVRKFVPFDDELNRYVLVVKNLPTAQAKIIWKDNAQDFTAAQLDKGINLAAEFSDSPFVGNIQNLDNAVRGLRQQERISGDLFIKTSTRDVAGQTEREAMKQTALARFVPVAHTIKIQPLAALQKQPQGPIPVIVDTDMSSDCDDAGAVALLNTFMNQGEANLIACVANGHDTDQSSGAAIQAINAYYGHPSIPIGAGHGETIRFGSTYTKKVRERFVPDFPTDDKLPAAVDVYRRALASAADGTVVIASLGLLQNLTDLLKSKPDAVSNLAGPDLVRQKVRKLVIMANGTKDDELVVTTWPTDILWTMDVGTVIYTGHSLASTPQNNPVRFIYENFGDGDYNALKNSRSSWDLTAAWLAVRGPGELWDVSSGGYWKVNTKDGGGEWINGPPTNQGLIMVKMPVPEVTKLIEAELSRPPKR